MSPERMQQEIIQRGFPSRVLQPPPPLPLTSSTTTATTENVPRLFGRTMHGIQPRFLFLLPNPPWPTHGQRGWSEVETREEVWQEWGGWRPWSDSHLTCHSSIGTHLRHWMRLLFTYQPFLYQRLDALPPLLFWPCLDRKSLIHRRSTTKTDTVAFLHLDGPCYGGGVSKGYPLPSFNPFSSHRFLFCDDTKAVNWSWLSTFEIDLTIQRELYSLVSFSWKSQLLFFFFCNWSGQSCWCGRPWLRTSSGLTSAWKKKKRRWVGWCDCALFSGLTGREWRGMGKVVDRVRSFLWLL